MRNTIGTGYYLRQWRMAALFAAFAGAMFYISQHLSHWSFHFGVWLGTPTGLFAFRFPAFFWFVLASVLLTLLAALVSRAKHGPRTLYDKDSNR